MDSVAEPSGHTNTAQLLRRAEALQLHDAEHWKRLVHYKTPLLSNSARSEVESEHFFLAAEGAINPKAELIATVLAFLEPIASTANNHPRCRFVARYQWLTEQLKWPDDQFVPIELCTDYMDWSQRDRINSVSLFFANGFLENPASFFGHAFLRFNVTKSTGANELLSTSLDYGALIGENENPIVYIAKGVFGGYQAGFSDGNYYRHNFDYGENQLRDLWEYPINLTSEQLELLLGHTWELMPHKFTYFFTYRNCGSAIADLMEMLFPGERFYRRGKPWVLPAEMFYKLEKLDQQYDVYDRAIFHPSRQTRFKYNYAGLRREQIQAFDQYVMGDGSSLARLGGEQKKQVLDVLIDYYQLLIAKNYRAEVMKTEKSKVIRERIALPSGRTDLHDGTYEREKPPHESTPPSMLRLSYVQGDDAVSGVVRYRPAQFDLLGLESGRPKNASLKVLDTQIEVDEEGARFKNIDLLEIVSINASSTDLSGDRPISWTLHLSYGQKHNACIHCSNFKVSAGLGKAFEIASRATVYGMIEGQVQSRILGYKPLSAIPSVGVIFDVGGRFKMHSRYAVELNGFRSDEVYSAEARYLITHKADFRVKLLKNINQEISAGLSFYW